MYPIKIFVLCHFPPLHTNRHRAGDHGNYVEPCAHTASLHGQTARAWRKLKGGSYGSGTSSPSSHSCTRRRNQSPGLDTSRHYGRGWRCSRQCLAETSGWSGGGAMIDVSLITHSFMNFFHCFFIHLQSLDHSYCICIYILEIHFTFKWTLFCTHRHHIVSDRAR